MATPNIEFDDFIMFSLEKAIGTFHQTKEYRLLNEKVDSLTEECKNNFNSVDYEFVEVCFEALLEADGQEIEYVYRQGYKDCINILRKLEVMK